jgi:hypothetical protein
LIVGEPARSLANSSFQLKMILLLLAIITTLQIQKIGLRDLPFESDRKINMLAIFSLLLWFGIVASGRWIAYT